MAVIFFLGVLMWLQEDIPMLKTSFSPKSTHLKPMATIHDDLLRSASSAEELAVAAAVA
jgi:hypothetical protein